MNIKEFYNTDFSAFATYSAFRGLANVVDGQKPSSRKVLCVAKKLNEKTKVSSLAARIVDTCEYIHGATSLEGVITGMAQSYTGTNNINLLEPKGDFGSVCIHRASSSRYISVNKEKIYDKIFSVEDDDILIGQEFEGTIIEPRFYVPIIPMLLVNGSEGIGTGFSQKILPRNPKEIITKLTAKLEGKTVKNNVILPYFNGFKGKITKTSDCSYEIRGGYDIINTTTIHVTELPIGYDIEKYNAVLAKLEEDKVIADYTDKSEPKENRFLFEIKVPREFTKKDDDYIVDKLKLIKKVTENFTCIGIENDIKEFKSESEIFEYYFQVRYDFYQKRKEYQLNKKKEDLLIAGSKFYFIKLILEDKIVIFKKTKVDIVEQIKTTREFPFYEIDGSYEYLLRLPVHSFSLETIEELKKQISVKKEDLKLYTEKTIESIWLDDLKEIKLK